MSEIFISTVLSLWVAVVVYYSNEPTLSNAPFEVLIFLVSTYLSHVIIHSLLLFNLILSFWLSELLWFSKLIISLLTLIPVEQCSLYLGEFTAPILYLIYLSSSYFSLLNILCIYFFILSFPLEIKPLNVNFNHFILICWALWLAVSAADLKCVLSKLINDS